MSDFTPKRPDYVAGTVNPQTGEKHPNVGGGWVVDQGRIRVKLKTNLPAGQVVILFPNQYKNAPLKSKSETLVQCAQCRSTERCGCNLPTTDVPYVYHDDCEGVRHGD